MVAVEGGRLLPALALSRDLVTSRDQVAGVCLPEIGKSPLEVAAIAASSCRAPARSLVHAAARLDG